VAVLDDLSTGFRDAIPTSAKFFQMDYGDSVVLGSLLKQSSFDAVFHFAAKALITDSINDPGTYFQANVASTITMLETIRKAGIRNFVFSSSAAVYGVQSRIPIEEDCLKQPINPYGLSKLLLEQTLEWYAKAYDWAVTVFRYFNAAGATEESGERHDPETHVIPLLLQAAAGERSVFEINGGDYDTPDGTCLRDYVHVLDIARAHAAALEGLEKPGMRVYNIGTGSTYSVRELCDAAARVSGREIPMRVSKRRPGDPPILCASNNLITRELRWKALHSSIEEILISAWRWKEKEKEAGDLRLAKQASDLK
jgi:UDP-glucose 4-epimerase